MDESPHPASQESSPFPEPLLPPEEPFIDRHGISPILFAFISLIILFISYQVIGGLLTLLLFGMYPTAENVSGFRLATGIGQLLLLFFPAILLLRAVTKTPVEFIRLRVPDWRTLGLSLVGIFSLQQMLQVYLVLQEKIPLPEELQQQFQELKAAVEAAYNLLVASNSVPELLWVIIVIAVIPAIAEEVMFRGLIQRSVERQSGPLRAALFTGCVFAAFHLNPFAVVPLIALGMYLGFLAYRADSLWVSIAAHFYNNAIASVAVYFEMNDDATVIGDLTIMSMPELMGTFWFFGVIFIITTYYFIHITRELQPDAGSTPPG